MAWIVQSQTDGQLIVSDLNITFPKKGSMKDVDLFGGRENVSRSSDLHLLLQKGFLKEVKKDAITINIDHEKINESINVVQETVNQISQTTSSSIQKLEEQQLALEQKIVQHNQAMSEHKTEVVSMMEKILAEVRSYAEKHPVEIQAIATAIKNIQVERGQIAQKLEKLEESDPVDSDAEIRLQERLLKMKDGKLKKNVTNLGKSISATAGEDIASSLAALDELGFSHDKHEKHDKKKK